MIIAVYGTLRKGSVRHHFLKEGGALFLGIDTASGFDMYAHSYPYLTPGEGKAVVELYEISPSLLATLDEVEQHPTLFERAKIKTDGGVEAEAYLFPKARIPPVAVKIDGDWNAWVSERRRKRGS
jgi:gamma-glutamylcyclotransferase (GGCT)/AIG2-like uncharacterized protein YtfP